MQNKNLITRNADLNVGKSERHHACQKFEKYAPFKTHRHSVFTNCNQQKNANLFFTPGIISL